MNVQRLAREGREPGSFRNLENILSEEQVPKKTETGWSPGKLVRDDGGGKHCLEYDKADNM